MIQSGTVVIVSHWNETIGSILFLIRLSCMGDVESGLVRKEKDTEYLSLPKGKKDRITSSHDLLKEFEDSP